MIFFRILDNIKYNFVQFCNFTVSLSKFLKILGNISDSFKLEQFLTHNTKVMAKDKKVNTKVTLI